MVKILLAADIHVPSSLLGIILDAVKLVKPEAIILSGDLSYDGKLSDIEKLFSKLRKASEIMRIISVLGNHDLWLHGNQRDSITKIERIGKVAEKYGVNLLDVEGRVEFGNYDIVGNVGWYDYSFAPDYGTSSFDLQKYENCNPCGVDKRIIKSNCIKNFASSCPCNIWHNDCIYADIDAKKFASENKKKIEKNIRGRKTIIVTHHAPLMRLIKERSFFNAFDGQDMSNLVFKPGSGISYYIYGHLHDRSVAPITQINGVTFINPFTFQLNLGDYIGKAVLDL